MVRVPGHVHWDVCDFIAVSVAKVLQCGLVAPYQTSGGQGTGFHLTQILPGMAEPDGGKCFTGTAFWEITRASPPRQTFREG
jgi:hypothetical protein